MCIEKDTKNKPEKMADVVVAPPAPEKPITQDAILPHNDVKLFNRWTFEDVQVLFFFLIVLCFLIC